MHIAELPDRGVIEVSGPDARPFLQNLITNDLDATESGAAVFAGLLSPQGKILADFFVVEDQDRFLLETARQHIPALLKRLTLYRLRANVNIEDQSNQHRVLAVWNATANDNVESGIAYVDPRLPDLGYRIIAGKQDSEADTGPDAAYHAHRIGLGVPEGGTDYVYGDTYPHEALYDDLHGVSFSKGCFVGQEVVSRMEHRNATKKRIVKVAGDGPLPECGTNIVAGDIALGRLGSSHHASGLALIRVDRLKDVAKKQATPTAAGIATEFSKPDWAGYAME